MNKIITACILLLLFASCESAQTKQNHKDLEDLLARSKRTQLSIDSLLLILEKEERIIKIETMKREVIINN